MLEPQDKKLAEEFGIDSYDEPMIVNLLAQYYETLNLRLAMALEEKLSDDQLLEFEKVHDAGNDAATKAWLKSVITDYDAVVVEQTEAVKADIKRTMHSGDEAASK